MSGITAEEQLTPDEEKAIVFICDMLIGLGATWDQIKVELFRVTQRDDPPFRRVPSQKTLERICLYWNQCDTMAELREKKKEGVKMSLKGKAVMMALSGNVPMLIFCLKNLCQWTDHPAPQDDDPDEEKPKGPRLAYDPRAI